MSLMCHLFLTEAWVRRSSRGLTRQALHSAGRALREALVGAGCVGPPDGGLPWPVGASPTAFGYSVQKYTLGAGLSQSLQRNSVRLRVATWVECEPLLSRWMFLD